MVHELQIGGVLLHAQNSTLAQIRKATGDLQAASNLPLFIGVDFIAYAAGQGLPPIMLGLGFGGGILELFKDENPECVRRVFRVEGLYHRIAGINQSLGPTVETYFRDPQNPAKFPAVLDAAFASTRKIGLLMTIKHFPFSIPSLHKETDDTKVTLDQAGEWARYFAMVAERGDFAMSTWIYSSAVDEQLAPLSRPWMRLFREKVGAKILLMTDAIGMTEQYGEARVGAMLERWTQSEKQFVPLSETVLAAETILAGHDLLLTVGNEVNTRITYLGLTALACQASERSSALRARIAESYQKIVAMKRRHEALLRQLPPVPAKLLADLAALYQSQTGTGTQRRRPPVCELSAERWSRLEKRIDGLGFRSTQD